MPLDAPTPRTVCRGRTEDREEVAFGIAHEANGSWRLRGFEGSEHALEVHDLRRRHIAALAEAGLQQVERERALRWAHLLDRQAAPRKGLGRNEMPVCPLSAVEVERRLLPLLRREALQKSRRRPRHGGRRRFGGGRQA